MVTQSELASQHNKCFYYGNKAHHCSIINHLVQELQQFRFENKAIECESEREGKRAREKGEK